MDKKTNVPCVVEGCDTAKLNNRGWCARHYMKWYRHGDTLWQKQFVGRTRTTVTWSSMKQRCRNNNAPDYKRYGGRGIDFQDSWIIFENFLNDMGERPLGKTLDRIDVNGNYCKENCRWANSETQCNNRTNNVYITYGGARFSATQWGKITGVPRRSIYWRLKNGWSVEDTLLQRSNRSKNKTKFTTVDLKEMIEKYQKLLT